MVDRNLLSKQVRIVSRNALLKAVDDGRRNELSSSTRQFIYYLLLL